MIRHVSALLLLAACAEAPMDEATLGQLPVPQGMDAFVVSEMWQGNTFRMTWADVPPGATVTFAVSDTTGVGPCPPFLQGTCFSLVNPTIVGRATADAAGVATLERTLPAGVPSGTYHFQALARAPGIDPFISETFTRGTGPSICSRIFFPVCGYDGVSYDNDCLAAVAGWPVMDVGFCP